MRLVLVAGLLLLTAACGAYSFPTGTTVQTGNVHGTVRVYPCAPVEQQGTVCDGIPGAGLAIVFSNGSQTSTSAIGPKGDYSIDLPAGTWKVSFKGIARIINGPNPVVVAAGSSIEADYELDSGIRAPGPPAAVP